MGEFIKIRGAAEHNLKNIDVDIPRGKFVVLTGLSGSGKSSLAFDTIYAEGQRRYMESISSYARQFLGQMEKPNVELIEGLSPAISIDQKSTNRNPRSTVGTVTEIYDHMRLLYARIGIPHCPECGKVITKQTVDQMVDKLMELPEGTKIQLMSPVVRGKKGRHEKVIESARKSGYVRVRVDGNLYDLSEDIELDKNMDEVVHVTMDGISDNYGGVLFEDYDPAKLPAEEIADAIVEHINHVAPHICNGKLFIDLQVLNLTDAKDYNRVEDLVRNCRSEKRSNWEIKTKK